MTRGVHGNGKDGGNRGFEVLANKESGYPSTRFRIRPMIQSVFF